MKKQVVGIVSGLVLQYLLGMSVNMFVHFPESGTEAQMWEFAKTQSLFWLHMSVGFLLLINAIVLYIRVFKQKQKTLKTAFGLGLGAIILAVIAGEEFVGSQNDSYSFIMAVGFIAALLSYIWGLFSLRS